MFALVVLHGIDTYLPSNNLCQSNGDDQEYKKVRVPLSFSLFVLNIASNFTFTPTLSRLHTIPLPPPLPINLPSQSQHSRPPLQFSIPETKPTSFHIPPSLSYLHSKHFTLVPQPQKMSFRELRNSFQRRLQIDRFVLEQHTQAELSPSSSTSTSISLNNQGASTSAMGHVHHPATSEEPKRLYFEDCFSPLDLPPDLLIYFIKFLTPGDLWKLWQVSKAMQSAVMIFMSRSQQFGFEAIRILRQEHTWTDKQLLRVYHEKHYEDQRDHFWITYNQPLRMIIPPFIEDEPEELQQQQAPGVGEEIGDLDSADTVIDEDLPTQQQQVPVADQAQPDDTIIENLVNNNQVNNNGSAPPPPPVAAAPPLHSRGVIRSQYWVSQANFLFAAVLESSEGFQSTSSSTQGDQEMAGPETSIPVTFTATSTASAAAAIADHRSDPAMGAFWTNQYETTKNISSQVAKLAMVDKTGHLQRATKDCFWSIVQLLFDSNFVDLVYRRAIINCARYMTAKFDSCFAYGLRVNGRVVLDTDYYDYDPKDYSVKIGPHLSMHLDFKSPRSSSDEAPKQPCNDEELNIIFPPRRLQSTLQVMLWRRCLTDLIGVYNRIQELHNSPVVIGAASSAHDHGSKNHELDDQANLCHHQKQTVEQQQRPIGRGFRKMIHRIRSVAKKRPHHTGGNGREKRVLFAHRGASSWSLPASFAPGSTTTWSQTTSASSFDDVSRQQVQQLSPCSFSERQSPYQQRRRSSESSEPTNHLGDIFRVKKSDIHNFRLCALSLENRQLQRRARMKERIRRETMLKEELLGLCHMACGLFLVRGQRPPEEGGPRSIMTLLRQGSPWNKGVWRVGEWQHAPLDLDHDLDETVMAHRYHLEREYRQLETVAVSQRRWSSYDPAYASYSSSLASSSSSSSHSSISFATGTPATNTVTDCDSTNASDTNEYASISDLLALLPANTTTKQDDTIGRGVWQSLCLETIKFLIDDNLAWGGNDPNHELSKLKATLHEEAWYYHE